MKARILIILVSLLVIVAGAGGQATDNTIYVKQLPGEDVGTKVANAMAMCNPDTSIPCILVIDPSLAKSASGILPALCAQCSLLDYRNGPFMPFNSAQGFGNNSIFVGMNQGHETSSRGQNAVFGRLNAVNGTSFYQSAILGVYAGQNLTTGYRNTYLGFYSGLANQTGYYNTAVGSTALATNLNGNSNTAVGYEALSNGNAAFSSNTCVGFECGYESGHYNAAAINTGLGALALRYASNGSGNTALGYRSQWYNVAGSNNTTCGNASAPFLMNGSGNTACGVNAGYDLETGAAQGTSTSISGDGATATVLAANSLSPGDAVSIAYTVNWNGVFTVTAATGTQFQFDSANTSAAETFAVWSKSTNASNYNTFLGFGAGRGITTGDYNTVIGAQVATLPPTLSNNIILADGQGNIRAQFDGTNWSLAGTTSGNFTGTLAGCQTVRAPAPVPITGVTGETNAVTFAFPFSLSANGTVKVEFKGYTAPTNGGSDTANFIMRIGTTAGGATAGTLLGQNQATGASKVEIFKTEGANGGVSNNFWRNEACNSLGAASCGSAFLAYGPYSLPLSTVDSVYININPNVSGDTSTIEWAQATFCQ